MGRSGLRPHPICRDQSPPEFGVHADFVLNGNLQFQVNLTLTVDRIAPLMKPLTVFR